MPRNWPHKPTTPTPDVTLNATQGAAILRALASGFATTNEMKWIADQLGADHIAHPLTPNPEVDRILAAVNRQATKDRDHYQRGWTEGRYLSDRARIDSSWIDGYTTGYAHAVAGTKANPYPPDEHVDNALLRLFEDHTP